MTRGLLLLLISLGCFFACAAEHGPDPRQEGGPQTARSAARGAPSSTSEDAPARTGDGRSAASDPEQETAEDAGSAVRDPEQETAEDAGSAVRDPEQEMAEDAGSAVRDPGEELCASASFDLTEAGDPLEGIDGCSFRVSWLPFLPVDGVRLYLDSMRCPEGNPDYGFSVEEDTKTVTLLGKACDMAKDSARITLNVACQDGVLR